MTAMDRFSAMLGHIRPSQSVLVIGCQGFGLLQALGDLRCRIFGVEPDPSAATRAEDLCERVIVCDLDSVDVSQALGMGDFDAILLVDTLQRARDPAKLLTRVRALLRDSGLVAASVPNGAHGDVRLALLAGVFAPRGIEPSPQTEYLYTLESIRQLVSNAGLAIIHIAREESPISASAAVVGSITAPPELVDALRRDPDARTSHYVVVARAVPEGMPEVLQRLRQLEDERVSVERQVAQLRDRVDALALEKEGLATQVEFMSVRESDFRRMLLDAHDQLLRRDDELEWLRSHETQLRAAHQQEVEDLRATVEALQAELRQRDDTTLALEAALRLREDTSRTLEAALKDASDLVEERTAWAQRAVEEVRGRDATIRCLQARVEWVHNLAPVRMYGWARRLVLR